ncbi:MAG TPA: serine hydrolase [Thermoanaerobaculia bacterium]|nr:serine hydrolase [Thermoanaerobaculia bacterium]
MMRRLASVTKRCTAILVLQLVEQGKLALDKRRPTPVVPSLPRQAL